MPFVQPGYHVGQRSAAAVDTGRPVRTPPFTGVVLERINLFWRNRQVDRGYRKLVAELREVGNRFVAYSRRQETLRATFDRFVTRSRTGQMASRVFRKLRLRPSKLERNAQLKEGKAWNVMLAEVLEEISLLAQVVKGRFAHL